MSRNIATCDIEPWHHRGSGFPRSVAPLRRPGQLLFPEDLAISRERHKSEPSTFALARATATGWETRAREKESAQRIATLEKRVEELEREAQGRTSEKEEAIFGAPLSREVRELIAGDCSAEEMDGLIVAIHAQIAAGKQVLAYQLACVAAGIPAPDDVDARCLALEALASAQLPALAPLLHPLIGFCLTSGIDRLQFRAIGAANTLPRSMRLELRPAIEGVVASSAPESAARRLGKLYLEHNK